MSQSDKLPQEKTKSKRRGKVLKKNVVEKENKRPKKVSERLEESSGRTSLSSTKKQKLLRRKSVVKKSRSKSQA